MLNNVGMGLVFIAQDLASGHIARLERNFLSLEGSITGGADRIRGAFKQVGVGLSLLSVGMATLAGAFALTNKAAEFEQAIAAVGAVSGASKEDIEALENAALKMGIATQYAPTEATKGLEELAQAGFNAQQSIALLKPVLDLAAGSLGRLSPEAAAGVAVQALRAFRIQTDDAGQAVDHMLKAVNVFSMNAGDLPLALGHAADGANILNQSLDETLVTFGLVHNIVPGVERAASAVSVAMERMADPRTQAVLKEQGVYAFDAAKRFRPFLDIIKDLAPALDKMTEKDRAAFLLKAFGHHALAGIGDILTQLKGGIESDTRAILYGADAVDYLRGKIANAKDAAKIFSAALLDTLAGQEKLLHGSLETLEIMIGKSFAEVFRPVVKALLDAINALLELIQATPKPIKRIIATVVLAAGAFLTLVGGVIALQGAVAVMSIGLEALGVSLGAIAATLGVAIGVIVLLGVVVAGVKVAFDRNLGGVADRVERFGEIISLVFRGISQLVEQGGFSGALREELHKAGNEGIFDFLVHLDMLWYRFQKFWKGLNEGFADAVEAAWPVFQALSEAFDEIANAVGDTIGAITDGAASLPSERFRAWGHVVGEAFAWIVESGAKLLLGIRSVYLALMDGARVTFGWISICAAELERAFDGLGEAWAALTGTTKAGAAEMGGSSTDMQKLAYAIGVVLGGAVGAVTWLLAGLVDTVRTVLVVVNAVKVAFGAVAEFVTALGQAIVWFFTEVLPSALSSAGHAIERALGSLGEVGATLFGFAPDGGDGGAAANVPSGRAVPLPSRRVAAVSAAVRAAAASSPAVAAASSEGESAARLEALFSASSDSAASSSAGPITVNLQVDGETLARAQANASRDVAGRSYSSVPVY